MALTTYSELQASIADWLDRTDLTTIIPDFITLAEAEFNRNIRVSQMENRATTSTVVGQDYYALPTDYLALRDIQIEGTTITTLNYMAPEEVDVHYDSADTGIPKFYTIVGNEFQLVPKPDAVYTLEISYYQKIPVLSDSNTSNWLLAAYPDIYLWGSILQAEPYLQNDQRMPLWRASLGKALEELTNSDRKYRWSGSGMRVRTA